MPGFAAKILPDVAEQPHPATSTTTLCTPSTLSLTGFCVQCSKSSGEGVVVATSTRDFVTSVALYVVTLNGLRDGLHEQPQSPTVLTLPVDADASDAMPVELQEQICRHLESARWEGGRSDGKAGKGSGSEKKRLINRPIK